MYNILQSANIITKYLCLILFIISIVLVNNPYLLLILLTTLLIINYQNKMVVKILLITILFSILNIFININFIIKLFIILGYGYSIKKIISFNENRLLIEKIFYKNRNNYLLKISIYILYLPRIFKNSLLAFKTRQEEMGLKEKSQVNYQLTLRAYRHTKAMMKKIMVVHNIRFYNSSASKTLEKIAFDVWDKIYITVHLIVFVLALIIR